MATNKDRFFAEHRPEPRPAFTGAEYARRLSAIRTSMQAAGIDLLFLSSPESICYVSGYAADWYRSQSSSSWRPASGIAIRADAEDYIHFDESDEAVLIEIAGVSRDIRIHQHADPPMSEFIVDHLRKGGWLRGTVGLEMWSYRPNRRYSEMFQTALERAGCRVVDATAVARGVRKLKSPPEQECVRKAAELADIGMEAARRALRSGTTELDVYGEIVHAMTSAGSENPPVTVAAGDANACAHALPSRRTIRAGDIVNIDICGVVNRYHATTARSFAIGRPTPAIADYHRSVAGAVELASETIAPNIRIGDVLSSVKAYCIDTSIWDDRWWIGGYELGIAFPPDTVGEFTFDADDDAGDEVFPPGLVATFESNFYLPEAAGLAMQISTMLVGQDTAAFLGRTAPDLIVVE
jgi:Xaa-Pro aminopeptidase